MQETMEEHEIRLWNEAQRAYGEPFEPKVRGGNYNVLVGSMENSIPPTVFIIVHMIVLKAMMKIISSMNVFFPL